MATTSKANRKPVAKTTKAKKPARKATTRAKATTKATKPARKPTTRPTATKRPVATKKAATKATRPAAAKARGARAKSSRRTATATAGGKRQHEPLIVLPVIPPPPKRILSAPVAPAPAREAPPAPKSELEAERDAGRLLRHGEVFGPWKLDVVLHAEPLPVAAGKLAVVELGDDGAPGRVHALARELSGGRYRVGLSTAKREDGTAALAAICLHVGRPPIARWVLGQKGGRAPKDAADAAIELGSGRAALADAGAPASGFAFDVRGDVTPYWAIDAAGFPVCLVLDLGLFRAGDWRVAKKR